MVIVSIFRWLLNLRWKEKNENIQIWSRYSLFKNTGCSLPASSSAALSYWVKWASNSCIPAFNTLRPRQNGCHFPDIFKWIFLNENVCFTIKISLKFVPKSPVNNIPALVQMMAWCRPGDKPLSGPVMVSLLMHICVTLPQGVNTLGLRQNGC